MPTREATSAVSPSLTHHPISPSLPNHETHISAHQRRPLKRHDLPALLPLPRALLRHIAQRDLVLRDLDLNIIRSLERRLVEARQRAPAVARLELRAEHVVVVADLGHARRGGGGWLVSRAVEARHVAVHGAGVFDLEDGAAGGDGGAEAEGHVLFGFLVGDGGGILGWGALVGSCRRREGVGTGPIGGGKLSGEELQLDRVEHDLCDGLLDLELDLHGAAVAEVAAELEVVEGDVIVDGLDAEYAVSVVELVLMQL